MRGSHPGMLSAGLRALAEVFVASPPAICWDAVLPAMAATAQTVRFWEDLWNAMLERIRVPVTGILLARDLARKVGEPVLARLVQQQGDDPPEAELCAEGMKSAAAESKEYVAGERVLSNDQERHRDPDDRRYEKNLCLPSLQERNREGRFHHAEWTRLDRFLRPFAFQILKNKRMTGEDGEDVFKATFASLAITKEKHSRAPIEDLIVFEEIIPNFCKLVGWRAVDAVRRRRTQKASPETLHSLDALEADERSLVQVADPATADRDRPDTWRFEEIYAQCREDLSAIEWGLLHDLYAAQRYTVKDLLSDHEKLQFLGIDPNQSASTLRRRVEDIINPALEKLADALAV
jgi:hypothetical protein